MTNTNTSKITRLRVHARGCVAKWGGQAAHVPEQHIHACREKMHASMLMKHPTLHDQPKCRIYANTSSTNAMAEVNRESKAEDDSATGMGQWTYRTMT